MNKSKLLPISAITFTAILWGLSFLSIKVSVMVIPPMTLALLRFLMASVILILMLKIMEPGSRLDKNDVPALFLAGLTGITVYFFFENNGVKLTTASVASMIIAIIPIMAILADYIFFRTPLSPFKIICVFVSVIGVYMVVGTNITGPGGRGNLAGNLLMLGAVVCWVVYSIVTRPLGKKHSQLFVVTYQTIFGTISLVPFSLLEMGDWQPVTATVMINVAFLGIFCSALGYYLYVYAMRRLGVGLVSMFINLIPVVTVISSYFILGETVSPVQVAGGILIILSVYLAGYSRGSKFEVRGSSEGELAKANSNSNGTV